TGEFTFGVTLFNGFTLVEIFFALGKGYLYFCEPSVTDEHPQRYNGKSPFLALDLQFFKLFFVKQQLTVTLRFMIVEGAVRVFGNVHITEVKAIVEKRTESVVD